MFTHSNISSRQHRHQFFLLCVKVFFEEKKKIIEKRRKEEQKKGITRILRHIDQFSSEASFETPRKVINNHDQVIYHQLMLSIKVYELNYLLHISRLKIIFWESEK